MGIIEGVWDCECGNKGILARYSTCTKCGRHKNKNTKFRMDRTDRYVEDTDEISKNPDWLCSYCNHLNSDKLSNCESCGASKQDSEKNYFEIHKNESSEDKQETPYEYDKTYNKANSYKYRSIVADIKNCLIQNKKICLTALVLLIAGILLLIATSTHTYHGEVKDLLWERIVSTEEKQTFQEKDWELPAGARDVKSKREIYGYEKVIDHYEDKTVQKSREVIDRYEDQVVLRTREVIDHYETKVSGYTDLGNGYFEENTYQSPVYRTETYTETVQKPVYKTEYYNEIEQVPVYVDKPLYKTKYYYTIDRWVHKDAYKTSGDNKTKPYWEEPKLASNERIANKKEKYLVIIEYEKDKELESKKFELDYNRWSGLNLGDTLGIEYSMLSGVSIKHMEQK